MIHLEQAVVVSIDPKRVYVNDATQVSKHTLVKTSRKGPGEGAADL